MKRQRWLALGGVIGLVLALLFGAVLFGLPQLGFNFWPSLLGGGGVGTVQVPAGFSVNVFADGLEGSRFMAVGPDGAIFVAERGADQIVALVDANGDGISDSRQVFAGDVPRPHSLVFHEGSWYVGITSGIIRLRDNDGDNQADEREVIIDDFPTGGLHSTRTVLFLPDGRMVVAIGSSCNVCEETDPRRAAIVIYDSAAGDGERVYAAGLRNAVGLALQPDGGGLWATNNGRDLMGDDLPPDALHRIEDGVNYGWPFCHNGNLEDPDIGFAGACAGVPAPDLEIQAHSAPLGLVFYDGTSFPAAYQGDLFVAYHGSWNRREPTGYKVVRVRFDGGLPASVEDFATGWLAPDGSSSTGRPVDVIVGVDGALYVSDDKAGTIYRISYNGGS